MFSRMDGSGVPEYLIKDGLATPEDIAFDYLARLERLKKSWICSV